MIVRKMTVDDIAGAATVHRESFSRQTRSLEWIESNLKAFPRVLCYVAVNGSDVLGYILWLQKSGFRPEAVLELDQLAVTPNQRCNGIGRSLIEMSLPNVQAELAKQNATLKHVVVTTRADNEAQNLYK